MKKRLIMIFAAVMMAAVMLPAGAYAAERTFDVDSGAEKTDCYKSYQFRIQDDTRQVYMVGLPVGEDGSRIRECLEENYTEGEGASPIKLVDPAFCDAEKWATSDIEDGFGSKHCWAASACNMVILSGWNRFVDKPVPQNEDEIFQSYNTSFTDLGGDTDKALDWFFMGEYYVSGAQKSTALFKPKAKDGHMKSFVSSLAQKQYDMTQDPSAIKEILKVAPEEGIGEPQSVFQISVGPLNGGDYSDSTHAITAAGLIIDPSAEKLQDKYRAIIIIDSDNDDEPTEAEIAEAAAAKDPVAKKAELKAKRPNSYTIYPLEYYTDSTGAQGWIMQGYAREDQESIAIYSMDELFVPSEELIEQNTETEGTMDHMKDPDLSLDELYMTESEEGFYDPYTGDGKFGAETEFVYGEPIRLNCFITNRSNYSIRKYEEGKPVEVTWTVTQDATGETVAEGTHVCELPILAGYTGGADAPDLITVNEKAGETEALDVGTYTLTAEINKDRKVRECYYKNNQARTLHFSVEPTREMAQEAVEAAKKAVEEAQAAVDAVDPAAHDLLAEAQQKLIAAQQTLTAAQEVLTKAMEKELKRQIEDLEKQVEDLEDQLFDASIIDISHYAVKLAAASYEYTGKAIKPAVRVSGLSADDYDVTYEKNVRIGTAKVIIEGSGSYTGMIVKTFKITKKSNKVKVRNTIKKVKAGKLKKKAVTLRLASVLPAGSAKGQITYKVKPANTKTKKAVTIKKGKVKIRKKTGKGTYKLKVTVKDAGSSIYKAASRTVTLTIKVK